MARAAMLSVANNEQRLADERVEGIGDRHLERQTPGIMNSLRVWAGRAPRPGREHNLQNRSQNRLLKTG